MATTTKAPRKRVGRVIEGSEIYLLRISPGAFYVRDDTDGRPLGCSIPSFARHMGYAEADDLCQRVKAQGYGGAVVTDRLGLLVDIAALEAERAAERERIQKFWESRN